MPEFSRNAYLARDSEIEYPTAGHAKPLFLNLNSGIRVEPRLSILFYGKKSMVEKDKQLAVYLRVTINGERFEVSAQRYVDSEKWASAAGKMKGNSEEARLINRHLYSLKQKVYAYQKKITEEGKPFTKESLRLKWFGKGERTRSPVEIFSQHNEQLKSLIGRDNSKATYGKYRTTLDHVKAFLKWKFGKTDIEISRITCSFITDFEFWLKSTKNCNHNTTIKYLSNLRKVINICLKNGWSAVVKPTGTQDFHETDSRTSRFGQFISSI